MKKSLILTATACAAMLLVTLLSTHARDTSPAVTPAYEFATVRFTEEKTCIVWPGGKVDNVFELSGKTKFDGWNEHYPKGSDYRMYWLTTAMNIMGQRGFELAHMEGPDVVMRRQLR